jgi:hypothetical protein
MTDRQISDGRLAIIMWLSIVVSISPLPPWLTGVGGNIFFLIGCLVFLIYGFVLARAYDLTKLPISLAPILISLPSIFYWRDPALALYPVYLIAAAIVFYAVDRNVLERFSNIASFTLLIMALGAWAGFIYGLLGGDSLLTIENPDGRFNDLFLTTFSNWWAGNLIRPSGLFDEAGTLSFVICFIAALRHQLGQSKRLTWQLLLLGIVTASLAHFIYVLFHAVQDRQLVLSKKKYIFSALLLGLIVFANFDLFDSAGSEVFFSRFVVDEGQFSGDTRSQLFEQAARRIDGEIFYFGLDSDCITSPPVCAQRNYGIFGETPAGLVLLLGFFLSAPYFFVLSATLWKAFRQRDFVLLALFLLLLQRPYVGIFGYSLLILLTVFASSIKRHPQQLNLISGTGLA